MPFTSTQFSEVDPVTAAIATVPTTPRTFTATQTFSGTAASLAAAFTNAQEIVTVAAIAATGTVTYYTSVQSVLYYTANSTANHTLNISHSPTTQLNAALAIGQAITVTFMNTNGATPYWPSTLQVDGVTQTLKWQGGTAPTGGNASSVDVYTYSVIKTANATFTVLASQTKFV
jgi:hypothetical protein